MCVCVCVCVCETMTTVMMMMMMIIMKVMMMVVVMMLMTIIAVNNCSATTCRMWCPAGRMLGDDGCEKCQCRNPCQDKVSKDPNWQDMIGKEVSVLTLLPGHDR